jgi:cytochrome c heme-lyase
MSKSTEKCPVREGSNDVGNAGESDKCPVKGAAGASGGSGGLAGWLSVWMKSGTPPSQPSSLPPVGYNEAANDAHFDAAAKFPGQKRDLSKQRAVSNIPKSAFTPTHQPGGQNLWIYPSEQQYYNAMKRKGYNPPEEDMSVILTIHNTVNEIGWRKILEWEALRGCINPKLARFVGRPKDLSPKARFLVAIGKEPPFDRHDWFVDRDGQEIRYVIDFYAVPQDSASTGRVPVHMDVRPALDSPAALLDRIQRLLYY